MVTSYMVQHLACSVGPYTMSSCMVTSYMVQQLISSVSSYTMSSVLTFVKVAGRGALAGPDGTVAGLSATETRTSTTRRKGKTENNGQDSAIDGGTGSTTVEQSSPGLQHLLSHVCTGQQ